MTVTQIDNQIHELKEQRQAVRGSETEVYARIVGYYRSVRNWNRGKKEEYGKRVNYNRFEKHMVQETPQLKVVQEPNTSLSQEGTESYLYFFRKTCPNCPPVAKWLEKSGMTGRKIDVDKESGMVEAQRYDVSAAPTVVFLDAKGQETGRSRDVASMEASVSLLATGA
ncbi:MAG: thiol reductase thioredoxin [Spirochaetales bacterium]|nr:thiol reductase thioredoxin [Spirochaetales bacterium]